MKRGSFLGRTAAAFAALIFVGSGVLLLEKLLRFRVVLLATDLAVWVLLFSVALFGLYAVDREQYRIAWRQIRARKLPMICLGVLCLYGLIGILDSFHLQRQARNEKGEYLYTDQGEPTYETDTLSLLDLVLTDLRTRTEKTYSAPLAIRAFQKERDEQTGRWFYPRLRYGGRDLADPSEHRADVIRRIVHGAIGGLVAGGALGLVLTLVFVVSATGPGARRRQIRRGLGFGAFFIVLFCVIGVVVSLSRQYHVLGTDKVGQDVLYQALKSCRTGLVVGTVTTLISTPFAIVFGISAGYFGGWVDDVVQYLYTTLSSIPGILLIAAAMLVVQTQVESGEEMQTIVAADWMLLWLCVVLGIIGWTGLCRLLRGETLKLREMDYVQAAHAFGVGHGTIMFRHILPNVMHIVLISLILRFSGLVLAEAVLAYVGIGVHTSMESWGNMINAARLEISRDPVVWWNLTAAFLFMFGLVLPANIFGDAVRDALDPRLRTE